MEGTKRQTRKTPRRWGMSELADWARVPWQRVHEEAVRTGVLRTDRKGVWVNGDDAPGLVRSLEKREITEWERDVKPNWRVS
jgi:hypothetical protein